MFTRTLLSRAVLGLASLLATLVRADDSIVATLPGEFSVDNKGSANYSIPLSIPPGRQGMQPKLSLNYGSSSGNGLLGIGFSLSTGFPQSITRGRSILARDGVVRGVTFTSDDKLYLDGKCLILVSGNYGTPGSAYRTEVDSFVTITTSGTGGNIETFVVTDKSGTKMTFGKYGVDTDGYQSGILEGRRDSLAYCYALKHVEDVVGNCVDFFFSDASDAGDYMLTRIEYTKNPNINPLASPVNTIELEYADRPDPTFSYIAGRRFSRSRRLLSITSNIEGEEVSKYSLGYERSADSGRTLLHGISFAARESAGTEWKPIPETTVEWSRFNSNQVAVSTQSLPIPALNEHGYNQATWGDFDGDGNEEYAILVNGVISVYQSTGSADPNATFVAATWMASLPANFGPDWTTLIPVDFNGDGRMDLLLGTSNPGALMIIPCLSTGEAFVPTTAMDFSSSSPNWFDNDVIDPKNNLRYFLASVEGGVFSRFVPGDFDGDGKGDILVHAYDGYRYVLRWNGLTRRLDPGSAMNPGFPGDRPSVSNFATGWLGSAVMPLEYHWAITTPLDMHPIPCDLNGDGVTDYMWEEKINLINPQPDSIRASHVANSMWYASISDAHGGCTRAQSISFLGIAASSTGPYPQESDRLTDTVGNYARMFLTGDFNGDGLTDFLIRNRGTTGWELRFGMGLVTGANYPSTENHPGALPRTFTANGEVLFTSSRVMSKTDWDYSFQHERFMDVSAKRSALARIQADSTGNMLVMDINHDGLDDLVWFVEFCKANLADPEDMSDKPASSANRGWWVAYSTGSGFSVPQPLRDGFWREISSWPHAFNLVTMSAAYASISTPDLNGDGVPDWVVSRSNHDQQTFAQMVFSKGSFGDLVTKITDGLGRTTEIAYKAAKDSSIYTPGAAVSYPIREVRGSNPVVAEVWKDSGSTDTANRAHFSYQYSGNRLDLSGRGSLGFHSFVTLDHQTNLFKYQFLAQSFPMTGLTAREQTYRYWEEGSNVKFRLINSHDNTVVFDEVVKSAADSTPWGTVYPFISQAIEYRWEDSSTAHFTYQHPSPQATPVAAEVHSSAEALFTAARPTGAHIVISAESLFDNQTAVQTTIPGSYSASDRAKSAADRTLDWAAAGTNTVVGSTSYSTFPRKITYGNLRKLKTDFGDGFTEQVDTTYFTPTSVGGLTGLAETVTTTVGWKEGTSTKTETAPVKSYTYSKKDALTWTPLVASEKVDAGATGVTNADSDLTATTTYSRDEFGRVAKTEIAGTDLNSNSLVLGSTTDASKAQHIGSFITSKVNAFDPKWDLPTSSQNADPYFHTTTTTYHPLLGLPTSVKDVNGAEVTTTYDALGRKLEVTDVLKNLKTTNEYAWTLTSTDDWKKTQTVTPPAGVTGIGPGAPITGVSAITATSVYAIRTETTVQAPVTAYYDRLGRVIRTVKEGFGSHQAVTDTVYNTLGQTIAVSLPYDPSLPEEDPNHSPLWTTTTYDALGRVVTVTAPNGTVTTNTYAGRTTTVSVKAADRTDTQSNATLVDAKGRTIKVWNASPKTGAVDTTGPASIEYVLDGFGRMVKTILEGDDSPGRRITATYDALGRQTSLNDPDKGNWTYVNNALGHVVYQKDAKDTVTRSTFDRLGRPLSRRTVETAGPVEVADWYYYDFSTDNTGQLHTVGHVVGSADRGWIGAPQRETSQTTGVPTLYADPGAASIHYYNEKGLPYLNLNLADGKYFYTAHEYDAYWRLAGVRYFWRPADHEDAVKLDPTSGGSVSDTPYFWKDWGYVYTYDGSGPTSKSYVVAIKEKRLPSGELLSWWQADPASGYDHLDRPVKVRKGDGHWTTRTYRATDGLLTAIKTGPTAGSSAIQDLTFDYDGLGNLKKRTGPVTESFDYDSLNRLTTDGMGYADNGNITAKKDVDGTTLSAYTYSGTKPHAVTGVTATIGTAVATYSYDYDANGNLTTRERREGGIVKETWSTRWAGFDKPRWLAKTDSSTGTAKTTGSEFLYNANRSRVVHLEFDALTNGAPSHYVRKKVYGLGPQLEADYVPAPANSPTPWALAKLRIYVPGPEGLIGTMEFGPTDRSSKPETALVYHYDHLGSIERITPYGSTGTTYVLDGAGRQSRYSYDAWGQRRDPNDWSGKPETTADGSADDATPRGFTGHEMLDDLGLVHMNGRIYDALIGRFLSADLQVQFPSSLQSYNRYSYVNNNPLTFFDPTGWGAQKAVETTPAAAPVEEFGRDMIEKDLNEVFESNKEISEARRSGNVKESDRALERRDAAMRRLGYSSSGESRGYGGYCEIGPAGKEVDPVEFEARRAEFETRTEPEPNEQEVIRAEPETGNDRGRIKESEPVGNRETGQYGPMASRSRNDDKQVDHSPSHASNRAREEARLGRPLKEEEDVALRTKGGAVVVPTRDHQQVSRTYGGRNNPQQIKQDAKDPHGAIDRDVDAYKENAPEAEKSLWEDVRDELHQLYDSIFGK